MSYGLNFQEAMQSLKDGNVLMDVLESNVRRKYYYVLDGKVVVEVRVWRDKRVDKTMIISPGSFRLITALTVIKPIEDAEVIKIVQEAMKGNEHKGESGAAKES